jgi:hypothetical protein
MNPFDFNFIVLPLGIIVFLLVGGIMLVLKRGEIATKRKNRRIEGVLKEKTKQRELIEKELIELNTMYDSKSIDADTYKRLQFLVKMNEEKEEETLEVLKKIVKE